MQRKEFWDGFVQQRLVFLSQALDAARRTWREASQGNPAALLWFQTPECWLKPPMQIRHGSLK